jgi:hypothetical protein
MPNSIPVDGSTIDVYVDGVLLGHPVYDVYRSDIASLFPGYANSNGAAAYFDFDTTVYDNGVHTIYWTAVDDAGNTDGIGSRYFSIRNSADRRGNLMWLQNPGSRLPGRGKACRARALTLDDAPVLVKRGYDPNAEPVEFHPSANGYITIETRTLQRIEIWVGTRHAVPVHGEFSGYMLVGNQLRPLPIGSTLDREKGVFYWQPGPGFMGIYELVFLLEEKSGNIFKRSITIKISP